MQTGVVETYFSEKIHGIFRFVTLLLEILEKRKLHLWKLSKIALQHLEFQDQKPRPTEIPQFFWLGENSTLFLLDPWNLHMLVNTPGNLMSSTPVFGFLLEWPINVNNHHSLFRKAGISIYLSFKPQKGNIPIRRRQCFEIETFIFNE